VLYLEIDRLRLLIDY